jgi:hypothetical protein
LTRVEERLSRLIETCAMKGHGIHLPSIPEHKDWVVTMWHFGLDASVEYAGERFSATWEVGEHALIRVYSKEMVEAHGSLTRNIVRLERQEYPNKTLQDAIQE